MTSKLTEDEVILAQLAVADLLLEGVPAEVDVDEHLLPVEDGLHLLGVGVEADADGDDEDLPRAQPERPLAREVLAEDPHEALYTAGHCCVIFVSVIYLFVAFDNYLVLFYTMARVSSLF